MSDSKIFFLQDNASMLTALVESPYDSEDILQALLARYSDLLPGNQIDPENPRRWLLVSREIGVPAETLSSDRWSLDHLFLDQDAIPTFVECKRSSDTRGRREVVAQMLDYAANGCEHWRMDSLQQAAAETARNEGKALDQELLNLMRSEDEAVIERFWGDVEANLRRGRVRLIFVADETPRELRRLVEFLNEKMADVEVLAIEVKQYIAQGGKAYVPRVIGLTEAARRVKGTNNTSARRSMTNREEFLANCSGPAVAFFTSLMGRVQKRGYVLAWGTVGFTIRVKVNENAVTFMYAWPAGHHGASDSHLDFYSDYLLSSGILPKEKEPELRQFLLALGAFKASGEFTFRATVDAQTSPILETASDSIFDRIDALIGMAAAQNRVAIAFEAALSENRSNP
jgi:hypothetical protein